MEEMFWTSNQLLRNWNLLGAELETKGFKKLKDNVTLRM